MRKTPTIEQATRIAAILHEVKFVKGKELSWAGHWEEVCAFSKSISGYVPSKGACIDCETKMLNILAEAVGLPPFAHETTAERRAFRMDVCTTCPAYHTSTKSCGRFILDALDPIPVLIDGDMVNPCGCSIPIKATFKHATCPAGKWH